MPIRLIASKLLASRKVLFLKRRMDIAMRPFNAKANRKNQLIEGNATIVILKCATISKMS